MPLKNQRARRFLLIALPSAMLACAGEDADNGSAVSGVPVGGTSNSATPPSTAGAGPTGSGTAPAAGAATGAQPSATVAGTVAGSTTSPTSPAASSTDVPAPVDTTTPSASSAATGSGSGAGGAGGAVAIEPGANAGSGGMPGLDGAGGAAGGANDLPPATFDDVSFFLNGSCGQGICHVPPGQDNPGFEPDLIRASPDELYEALTTYTVEECDNLPLVTPGDPDNSALIRVVSQQCGELMMPKGCDELPSFCLFPEQIELLTSWVRSGAPR